MPAKLIGEVGAQVIGWAVRLGAATGAYSIAYKVAPYVGMQEHRDAFGLLSALALAWLYEHREAHDRWEGLKDRLDRMTEHRGHD